MTWDTSDMERGIRDLEDRMRRGVVRGLNLAAEELLGRASNLAPIDEGTLSQSGRSHVNEADLSVDVGMGNGASRAYAVRQHEDLTYRHSAGRQAKYFEEPMNAFGDDFIKIVGKEVEREL